MTDLVKRLRLAANPDCWVAADEIERYEREDAIKAASNATLLETVKRLSARVEELERGLKAVETLIAESGGVYGLHLNGDPAPWEELRSGGRFEDWLRDFDAAKEGKG